jgi:hypothetical protein
MNVIPGFEAVSDSVVGTSGQKFGFATGPGMIRAN